MFPPVMFCNPLWRYAQQAHVEGLLGLVTLGPRGLAAAMVTRRYCRSPEAFFAAGCSSCDIVPKVNGVPCLCSGLRGEMVILALV